MVNLKYRKYWNTAENPSISYQTSCQLQIFSFSLVILHLVISCALFVYRIESYTLLNWWVCLPYLTCLYYFCSVRSYKCACKVLHSRPSIYSSIFSTTPAGDCATHKVVGSWNHLLFYRPKTFHSSYSKDDYKQN